MVLFFFSTQKCRESLHLVSIPFLPTCFMLLTGVMFGGLKGVPSRPPKVLYPCKRPKDFPVNLLKDHKSYPNLLLSSPISYFLNACRNYPSVRKAMVRVCGTWITFRVTTASTPQAPQTSHIPKNKHRHTLRVEATKSINFTEQASKRNGWLEGREAPLW